MTENRNPIKDLKKALRIIAEEDFDVAEVRSLMQSALDFLTLEILTIGDEIIYEYRVQDLEYGDIDYAYGGTVVNIPSEDYIPPFLQDADPKTVVRKVATAFDPVVD